MPAAEEILQTEKYLCRDSLETVHGARGMRYGIMEEYRRISGNSEGSISGSCFLILGKFRRSVSEEKPLSMDYEMLLARCNIFEALLIKHFRSAEDFDKMIMK